MGLAALGAAGFFGGATTVDWLAGAAGRTGCLIRVAILVASGAAEAAAPGCALAGVAVDAEVGAAEGGRAVDEAGGVAGDA